MRARRIAVALALASLGAALPGCLFMPRDGTDVYVERRTGSYWSGAGKLVAVSDDARRCKVVVRTRALFVESKWVDCRYVHARTVR